MKNFIQMLKRYRVLFLIELLVIVAVSAFFSKDVFNRLIPYKLGYASINGSDLPTGYIIWWISEGISEGLIRATTPVVLVFTLIRYIVYDNKNQRILNNSFPVSNRQRTLFEMLIGGIPIMISVVLYGVLLYCFGSFAFFNDGSVQWTPNFTYSEISIIFMLLLLLLGLHAFLVFSKKVSSSIGGTILLYLNGVYLSIGIFVSLIEPLWNKIVGNEFLYELFPTLVCAFPLAFSIIGSIIADKKLDIAKGGTYYFKPLQIIVCIMSGISFCTWMLGFFDSEKGGLTPLYITISVIISLLVTGCVFYLTKEKKTINAKAVA